jgi:hypothetical protein
VWVEGLTVLDLTNPAVREAVGVPLRALTACCRWSRASSNRPGRDENDRRSVDRARPGALGLDQLVK